MYSRKLLDANKHQQNKSTKEKEQQKTKNKKDINYKERELRNRRRESLDVSPQALTQSKREPEKRASSWSSDLSKSSNVCRFVPSKYTTSNTMELNSKCEMNAFPTKTKPSTQGCTMGSVQSNSQIAMLKHIKKSKRG